IAKDEARPEEGRRWEGCNRHQDGFARPLSHPSGLVNRGRSCRDRVGIAVARTERSARDGFLEPEGAPLEGGSEVETLAADSELVFLEDDLLSFGAGQDASTRRAAIPLREQPPELDEVAERQFERAIVGPH